MDSALSLKGRRDLMNGKKKKKVCFTHQVVGHKGFSPTITVSLASSAR